METDGQVGGKLTDLSQIDRMVHKLPKLMILMVLYTVEEADFTFMANMTELTDGNLSSHLTKLEEAEYVENEKGYTGKNPHTTIRLRLDGWSNR